MQKLDKFQTLFIEGQFRKGDVIEITINGSTSKFTIPFLGIEDVGEEVSLEKYAMVYLNS